MKAAARKSPRSGKTDKVSVSIDRADLVTLRKRARRLYHGNLSAVVAEGMRRVREEEGREALVAWLNEQGNASPAQRDAIRAEWTGAQKPERAKRRRST
jgi:hypothetical protein